MTDLSLYQQALRADNEWAAEGYRIFGNRWGDVRYTASATGEPGSELRRLYGIYYNARAAWHAAGRPMP